ncbi:hypothetical protein AB0C11_33745 [Streptomyces sp. NPDC039016]|uniref:hypothetical protein n=1 Tax=Streptomyces sp. NPDC039016 TaxID=3154330 RepID=UPI0033C210DC
MKFAADQAMLSAWARLLGLGEQQAADVLTEIELALRRSYAVRSTTMRHLSFEQVVADMDEDEFAFMYLRFGLYRAGQDDLAEQVISRAHTFGPQTA